MRGHSALPSVIAGSFDFQGADFRIQEATAPETRHRPCAGTRWYNTHFSIPPARPFKTNSSSSRVCPLRRWPSNVPQPCAHVAHRAQLLGFPAGARPKDSDVNMAVERALNSPLPEGYSPDVLRGRAELLVEAKSVILQSKGRMTAAAKGVYVPPELARVVLAVLVEVCRAM
eukprot:227243-Chlamydomonas_euryale.AAC.4